MRHLGILLLILVILFCFSTNAKGEPISDPSQLSPNPTIIDFETVPGSFYDTSLTIGDVTFTSVTATLSILNVDTPNWPIAGVEVAGQTLFPGGEPDSAILITFANPISEFLVGWGDPNYSGNFLRAYDGDGFLQEEIEVPYGPTGGVFATWVGFVRPTADITTVIVQPNQLYPNGDDYVIDNIHYNSPQIISIDIKPGSCPNPFNLKSRGVLPVAILGSADFDVTMIDPASIKLLVDSQEVAPIRSSLEDVSTPFIGEITSCEDCTESGPDGYMDLTLKFKTQAIVQAIGVENVNDGDCFILTLTGKLDDGTSIVGEDVLRILKKGRGRFPNFKIPR